MCVLVDSFEVDQARPVLVGWVVGVGAGPVPPVPAQNKGRLRKHRRHSCMKARTEAQKGGKHARKHRKHERTESTTAQKAQPAQTAHTHRETAKKARCPDRTLLLWVLLTAAGWRYGRACNFCGFVCWLRRFGPCSTGDSGVAWCEHTAGFVTGGDLVEQVRKNKKCSKFSDVLWLWLI